MAAQTLNERGRAAARVGTTTTSFEATAGSLGAFTEQKISFIGQTKAAQGIITDFSKIVATTGSATTSCIVVAIGVYCLRVEPFCRSFALRGAGV